MTNWREMLGALMRERGHALFGYAYVLTGDPDEARDLVQDALVRAFGKARSPISIDAAHVYVKRAIATAFIDRARRAAVRPALVGMDEGAADRLAETADTPLADRSNAAIDLHRALLTLSRQERACVVLRYLEDMSVDEVSDALDIAPGTVKRYVSDALSRLRLALPQVDFTAGETTAVRSTKGGA